jgi:TrmH family RNA methyltransferase
MEVGIKTLRKLTQKKYRREFSLCILEGEKIIADNRDRIIQTFKQTEIPKELLKEVKCLNTYTGDIAVAYIPKPTEPTTPFLVLDNIQEAGNMGTIIRTAVAFGYRTVYCINCADPYSPKVLRASSGMCLQLNIIECDYADLPNETLYIADLDGYDIEATHPTGRNFGIVLGNEGCGVSPEIYAKPHIALTIPMQNGCESLNVAVAGGIFMYKFSQYFDYGQRKKR